MATPAKRWPTNAEWARMDALAQAGQGRRLLLAELDRIEDIGLMRRIAKAIEKFSDIERTLGAVGPQAEKADDHGR
jgi:hypothetical protein